MQGMQNKALQPFTDIDSLLPLIKHIPIFGALSKPQLHKLFIQLKQLDFEKGECVFKQGDDADDIFIIQRGAIKLISKVDETSMDLVELQRGQCFGETSCIGIQAHSATAQVLQATRLLVLTRSSLVDFYENDKALFSLLILNIAREACRRLVASRETALHYALQHR